MKVCFFHFLNVKNYQEYNCNINKRLINEYNKNIKVHYYLYTIKHSLKIKRKSLKFLFLYSSVIFPHFFYYYPLKKMFWSL